MAKSFLLTIDVGNSSTSLGIFDVSSPALKKPRLLRHGTIPTHDIQRANKLNHRIRRLWRSRFDPSKVKAIMIASVVPKINPTLKRSLRQFGFSSIYFVTGRTPSRIKNRYKKPDEVGADRIVNARAAYALGKGACVVVDFGTATTFDCISRKGDYLGGVICPGPVMSARALFQWTAKLPHVALDKPVPILGKNTRESIQAGLYFGYRGLVQEIVVCLKKKLGSRTTVLATGGQARWILKGLPLISKFVPSLTLMGLYWYWKDQQS